MVLRQRCELDHQARIARRVDAQLVQADRDRLQVARQLRQMLIGQGHDEVLRHQALDLAADVLLHLRERLGAGQFLLHRLMRLQHPCY